MNSEENQFPKNEKLEETGQLEESDSQNWDDEPEIPEIDAQIVEEPPKKETRFSQTTPDWWNSESELLPEPSPTDIGIVASEKMNLEQEIAELKQQKQTLETEIKALLAKKSDLLAVKPSETPEKISQLVEEGLKVFEQRKQALEISVEQLERRRERIREEMRTTFAGVSQELAIRVQGFKEYLVGSLQDLVAAAEQLELTPPEDSWEQNTPPKTPYGVSSEASLTPLSQSKFQDQTRRIQEILDQYRTRPDYYGPPWQLRRTFEPIHADRVKNWFFTQGGRGAIRSMGSRLQNILIASAIISVIYQIYGDRSRVLILVDAPEQLGEWRRGLQDCLGISRSDFAPERGIGLFESPEALVQKADRLLEDKKMPLVIIDEAAEEINLSLLQFPLWLAYAPDPQQTSSYLY